MESAKTCLLDEVCVAADFEHFYERHNLRTTDERIDCLAAALGISVRSSEKYISDAELLELLEECALSYPLCR